MTTNKVVQDLQNTIIGEVISKHGCKAGDLPATKLAFTREELDRIIQEILLRLKN